MTYHPSDLIHYTSETTTQTLNYKLHTTLNVQTHYQRWPYAYMDGSRQGSGAKGNASLQSPRPHMTFIYSSIDPRPALGQRIT